MKELAGLLLELRRLVVFSTRTWPRTLRTMLVLLTLALAARAIWPTGLRANGGPAATHTSS